MSGYLEVKYPFKSNLGLNPFKTWKKQWCILRPSATEAGGGSLAVYCSEAGAAAGCIELPAGCLVRRAKSRSRPHAFAVFSPEDSRKPRILLAAHSTQETQLWIEKIKVLMRSYKYIGTETLLKDTYPVSVATTELSRKCGISYQDGTLTLTTQGLNLRAQTHTEETFIQWTAVTDVEVDNRTCILSIDSGFSVGAGEVRLTTPLASELVETIKQTITNKRMTRSTRRLSKSDGDLRALRVGLDADLGEVRRSSWYSEPSEVSLDDTDLVMSKESTRIGGQLSRCSAAGDLAPPSPLSPPTLCRDTPLHHKHNTFDDSMSDRRSLVSVASGIYEEIPDMPAEECAGAGAGAGRKRDKGNKYLEEPTYESVADCVYATMRRTGKRYLPPPLPPRLPFGTLKLGESWHSRMNKSPDLVTRHSSLGSIPRCCSVSSATSNSEDSQTKTQTLPKQRPTFNVFRKRLKSDSNLPKSESAKENKDTETKKKKFDFTPTRDIFKSFKVGRKMKGLKIASGNLKKIGETKSCEFLDDTVSEHVNTSRCSKSVECLENEFDDENETDLSIEYNDDAMASLSLPQDIVDLILRGREQISEIRLKTTKLAEDDYMPMSPIVAPPPPIEHHYIVMSPRTNIA